MGSIENWEDFDCYIADKRVMDQNSSKHRCVLVLPDVGGIKQGRLEQICDDLAAKSGSTDPEKYPDECGNLVVCPDIYKGETCDAEEGSDEYAAFVKKFPYDEVKKVIKETMDFVKSEYQSKSLRIISFGHGGYAHFNMIADFNESDKVYGWMPAAWDNQKNTIPRGVFMEPSATSAKIHDQCFKTLLKTNRDSMWMGKDHMIISMKTAYPDLFKPEGELYAMVPDWHNNEFGNGFYRMVKPMTFLKGAAAAGNERETKMNAEVWKCMVSSVCN